MAGYNAEQLNTMRMDAINRVQEMQRRSQSYIRNNATESKVIDVEIKKEPERLINQQQTFNQTNNQNSNCMPNFQNKMENQNTQYQNNGYNQNNPFNNFNRYNQMNKNHYNQQPIQNLHNSQAKQEPNKNSFQNNNVNGFDNNTRQNYQGGNSNPIASLLQSLGLGGGRQGAEPNGQDFSANGEKKKNFFSGIFEELLPGVKFDDDKVIIILLIIILAKNGSDMKLLLALGYLLL